MFKIFAPHGIPLIVSDTTGYGYIPNVGFSGQIVYVAMRDINPGEELCHDYSMERADDYSLECRCGSKYCRGRITGDDWKRPDLQERYGDRFSSYIIEKIKKSSRDINQRIFKTRSKT